MHTPSLPRYNIKSTNEICHARLPSSTIKAPCESMTNSTAQYVDLIPQMKTICINVDKIMIKSDFCVDATIQIVYHQICNILRSLWNAK